MPDLIQQREARGQQQLPGAGRISQGEQARRASARPLQPRKPQQPLDIGLFNDDAKQTDLF